MDDMPKGLSHRLNDHQYFDERLAKNKIRFRLNDSVIVLTHKKIVSMKGNISELRQILKEVLP